MTPREWWLYRLIKGATEQGILLSIPEIIARQEQDRVENKLTFSDLYQFKESEGNHSNCPAIYEDIHTINESDEIDKIICFKNNQFYVGNESEMIEYHNKLYHNVCRDSHKCKIIRDKISQEGQGKLFTFDLNEISNSKGREYHEAFIKNESLVKENDKLKEMIKLLKNENKMWKERALCKN